jgi:hypothetical protein
VNSFRFGIRELWRNPVLSGIVVLTLGIGIGASTTFFSVANAVLLRPLPFAESDRLVWLWSVDTDDRLDQRASYPDFVDWQSKTQTLDLVGYGGFRSVMSGRGDAERLHTELFVGDLFELLGVPPMLGSVAAGATSQPVVILSHGLWRRRFDADPDVIGTSAILDGTGYSIAAVMPPGFQFPIHASETVDAWVPVAQFNPALARNRGARLIEVIGRMRPDATLEQAQAEMDVIA